MRTMRHYIVPGLPNLIPGSHNEIIEWLGNFGILGFCVMLLIFFRFYYAGSLKHLCLCILPSFLFCHNFFETTALQVALACAFYLGLQASRKAVVSWARMPMAASYRSAARPEPPLHQEAPLTTERIRTASGAGKEKGKSERRIENDESVPKTPRE